MKGLLSQDILVDILKSTGAYKGSTVEHVIQGDFKRFNFQFKNKKEFDISVFEEPINKANKRIQEEWSGQYIEKCQLQREGLLFEELRDLEYRESSICVQIKSNVMEDSFFIYFQIDTFYCLLNEYLGGGELKSGKSANALTDIEMKLFQRIVTQIVELYSYQLNRFSDLSLEVVDFCMSDKDQRKNFVEKYLVSESFFEKSGSRYGFIFAQPVTFLDFLKRKQEEDTESEHKRQDPLWQKVITNVFFNTALDFKISLGDIKISFAQSMNLKEGDMFDWDKENTQVILYQDDKPQLKGGLGVVGDNYAIRVEDLIKN